MKDFTGYEDVIKAISEARRIARDHAPRGSNDDLEAGLFLASCLAMQDYTQAQARKQYDRDQGQSAAPSVAEPNEEPALRGEGPEPSEPPALLSEDDVDPEDNNWSEDQDDTEYFPDGKPKRKRGKK
jgi:hypothetical protein